MARARKRKFGKLAINLYKAGEVRYETAYYADEAARKAAKWARKGWQAKVSNWGSEGYAPSNFKRSAKTLMECHPASSRRGKKQYAHCTMSAAFKKRIRGR